MIVARNPIQKPLVETKVFISRSATSQVAWAKVARAMSDHFPEDLVERGDDRCERADLTAFERGPEHLLRCRLEHRARPVELQERGAGHVADPARVLGDDDLVAVGGVVAP